MQTEYYKTILYSAGVSSPRPYAVDGFPGLTRRAEALSVREDAKRSEGGTRAVIPYAVEGFPGLKEKRERAFEEPACEKGYAHEPGESGYAFRLYGAAY